MKYLPKKYRGVVICSAAALLVTPLFFFRSSELVSTPNKERSSSVPSMISSPAAIPSSRMMTSVSNPSAYTGSRKVWPAPTNVSGEKLGLHATSSIHAHAEDHDVAGRTGTLDMKKVASPATMKKGDVVAIPLFDGEEVEGRVHLVQPETGGVVRVGGKLTGTEAGTFSLTQDPSGVSGRVLLTQRKTAYVIKPEKDGSTSMVEKPLGDIVCSPYPRPDAINSGTPEEAQGAQAAQTVPILSSRPNAPAVLYLDFDGETVTDPDWNGGEPIVAPAFRLTEAQIARAWRRVKEDFLPFNVDVTTNVDRYDRAAPGSRMRCIITPNNVVAPRFGGVAYVDSFSEAGEFFSSTVPCWAFNSEPDSIAAVVSHEFGHTLGLNHDGRVAPREEYFDGHGTGAVSWGPIMGSGYYANLTQWSRGEYESANNPEDDLNIIASMKNGFGFISDDSGDLHKSSSVLGRSGTSVSQAGVISTTGDADFFAFTMEAGMISINATPALPSPNLDIKVDLLNVSGGHIASYNPSEEPTVAFTRELPTGTYFLRVSGAGRGDVLKDGYSNYGSLGAYTLSGNLPPITLPPVIISPDRVSGVVNSSFSYKIIATNNPGAYSIVGALPAGLSFNSENGVISGTPTQLGDFPVQVRAGNSYGIRSKPLAIRIATVPEPVVTSPKSASGLVGTAFEYQITAENEPTSYVVTGDLPPGLSLDPATGVISGTPTVPGTSSVTIGATNEAGTGESSLSITVSPNEQSLAAAVDYEEGVWITGNRKWSPVTNPTFDGVDAARSGQIGHKGKTWMQTTIVGPAKLSFRWRVSCEPRYDLLALKVDGRRLASITGRTAWQSKVISIAKGTHTIQWSYEKDLTITRGLDAGFVDVVSITPESR